MKLFLLEATADYWPVKDGRVFCSWFTFVVEEVPRPDVDFRLTSLKCFYGTSAADFGELILRESSC